MSEEVDDYDFWHGERVCPVTLLSAITTRVDSLWNRLQLAAAFNIVETVNRRARNAELRARAFKGRRLGARRSSAALITEVRYETEQI